MSREAERWAAADQAHRDEPGDSGRPGGIDDELGDSVRQLPTPLSQARTGSERASSTPAKGSGDDRADERDLVLDPDDPRDLAAELASADPEREETRRARLRESGHALRESGAALIESGAARMEASSAALREASGAALRKVEASAPPGLAARIRRFRERIRHRRSLDTAWRVGVAALGGTLLLAGAIMFVVPGPGFATIILGLVILGSEFAWATRLLTPVKGAAARAAEAAMDPRRRKRNLILAGCVGVALGLAMGWYFSMYGFTLQPLLDLSGAAWEWVKGLFD